jgi:dTDP-4-dehydrorhamnose reductase
MRPGRDGLSLRVLILGGAGMLGHKLAQQCADRFDTSVTFRGSAIDFAHGTLFDHVRTLSHVDATSFDSLLRSVVAVKPDAVVNCIGIIKQLASASDPILSLETNSLLPHRLARLCSAVGARLIHISTDCVFSGSRGRYTEDDISDAQDLYGRTKFLGEVSGEGALTLRTSIIGRELRTTSGLVEWFLAQRGKRVQGWTRAIYTGFPTIVLARIIADILEQHRNFHGLYQVASAPINKYELLGLIRDAYDVDVEIEPTDGVAIDRSLDGTRFGEASGIQSPTWPKMVREMAGDPTPYDEWR